MCSGAGQRAGSAGSPPNTEDELSVSTADMQCPGSPSGRGEGSDKHQEGSVGRWGRSSTLGNVLWVAGEGRAEW